VAAQAQMGTSMIGFSLRLIRRSGQPKVSSASSSRPARPGRSRDDGRTVREYSPSVVPL
jgi:hypothetical protein